jgi:hypothetical protein
MTLVTQLLSRTLMVIEVKRKMEGRKRNGTKCWRGLKERQLPTTVIGALPRKEHLQACHSFTELWKYSKLDVLFLFQIFFISKQIIFLY